MKFANQTMRRTDQTLTKAADVISPSLWLSYNSKLNVKSPTVKISKDRRVLLNLFGILYSKQLNRKSVKG